MFQSTGKKSDAQTVRNVLYQAGYHGRSARKKPHISKINSCKRQKFAERHVIESDEFWKNVVFSDESKYDIFGSDGHSKVWRKKNTEFNKENIIPTVKHGGGNVMVWGCVSASGVGNLIFIDSNMDRYGYLNILKENLIEIVKKMGLDEKSFMFQQDNDPKHTSKIVKEWCLYNIPKQLHTPPQSPDLNPIEHVWDLLERRIRTHSISSKETLKSALLEEWRKISSEELAKLVLSMKNRLKAVLKSKGGPTKY